MLILGTPPPVKHPQASESLLNFEETLHLPPAHPTLWALLLQLPRCSKALAPPVRAGPVAASVCLFGSSLLAERNQDKVEAKHKPHGAMDWEHWSTAQTLKAGKDQPLHPDKPLPYTPPLCTSSSSCCCTGKPFAPKAAVACDSSSQGLLKHLAFSSSFPWQQPGVLGGSLSEVPKSAGQPRIEHQVQRRTREMEKQCCKYLQPPEAPPVSPHLPPPLEHPPNLPASHQLPQSNALRETAHDPAWLWQPGLAPTAPSPASATRLPWERLHPAAPHTGKRQHWGTAAV